MLRCSVYYLNARPVVSNKSFTPLIVLLTSCPLQKGPAALGELDDSEGGGWGGDEELLDDSEIIAVKNEALKQKRVAEREKRKKEKERSSKLS